MPDERMGEVGCAFIIPRDGAVLVPEDIVAWSRATMANYKVPRHVEVCDDLPRTANGKVIKDHLRERAAALALNGPRTSSASAASMEPPTRAPGAGPG
jgi:acyl-CoA synthetase (AMP-forming)/AMP-acid ligase II